MKIRISNQIGIEAVSDTLNVEIRKLLTVQNPAYQDAVKMNRRTNGIPHHIRCYQKTETALTIPRGFIRQLVILAKQHNETFEWTDETRTLAPVNFQFKGKLRKYQDRAATAVWGASSSNRKRKDRYGAENHC